MRKAFVSRGSEIQQLKRYEHKVLIDRKPQVVLIQGDVGVGKTSLIEYFIENAASKRQFLVGRGRCSMETETEGLLPFAQVIIELTNQGMKWNVIKGNMGEFLKKVAPAWLDILTAGFATAVTTTVDEGRKLADPKFKKLSQDSVFLQYSNAIKEITDIHPTIIFLDDLHWADRSSLKLLFHLVNNLKNSPLLIIATFRPVEAMETGTNAELFREVHANLFRLGAVEFELKEGISVANFVREHYGRDILPSALIERIQTKTEGHALYVTELFKLWEESRLIKNVPEDDSGTKWEIANDLDATIDIPLDLEAVLSQRISLLSQLLQDLLKIASVEGEDFTAQTMINLLKADDLKVFGDLVSLEKKYRLVQEKGQKTVSQTLVDFYRFTHRFVRDFVYYKQLGRGERRILHQRVAECMEVIYENIAPVAGQIARHFLLANQLEKAAKYMLLAAKTEQSRFAWSEAESWCQSCLDTLDKLLYRDYLQSRIDVLETSARGYYNTSEYNHAIERLNSAIKIAEDNHLVSDQVIELYAFLTDTYECIGLYDEGLNAVNKGKKLLTNRGQALSELDIALIDAEALLKIRSGEEHTAIEMLREALNKVQSLKKAPSLLDILAGVYNSLGIAYSYLSMYTDSIPMYQKAAELAEQVGDRSLQITCLLNLTDDNVSLGNYDEAEKVANTMLTLSKQTGDHDNEAYSLYELGSIELRKNKLDAAESFLKQAIAIWEGISVNLLPIALADLATIYLSRSQYELAVDYARKGWNITAPEYEHAYAQIVLSRAETKVGMYHNAEIHFQDLILSLQNNGNYPEILGDAKSGYADLLINMQHVDQARQLLQEALHVYQDLGNLRLKEIDQVQRILNNLQ